ncbi:GDSL-type esterase/lipase family protein [Kribbella sindirgiensis]|uniref:GDSL-type esterase/lipase family protein n=1 Tax=Kribbella sindirgiensis TaxID=1124744 RepID=UPI00192D27A9|nr:GDSL-type esterase/lipase family protein [Kribbella sindirgiensis]
MRRLGGVEMLQQVRDKPGHGHHRKPSAWRAFLGSVLAIGVTLLVVALLGGVLVVLDPRSTSADTAVSGSYSVPSGGPGRYGSGTLGPWQNLIHRISPEDQIREVLAFDGVFMFGDSIAVQDSAALERLLADRTGDAIAFHDWSGQPASAAVDALEEWSRTYGLPRRIVIAAGTNDIFDPPAFAAQIERALRIAGPDRTVYWVNVYVDRTKLPASVRAADRANSAWINQQLQDAEIRHPNLRIIDWAGFLTSQPNGPAQYLRDGVHTSQPAGGSARNELIADAIRNR